MALRKQVHPPPSSPSLRPRQIWWNQCQTPFLRRPISCRLGSSREPLQRCWERAGSELPRSPGDSIFSLRFPKRRKKRSACHQGSRQLLPIRFRHVFERFEPVARLPTPRISILLRVTEATRFPLGLHFKPPVDVPRKGTNSCHVPVSRFGWSSMHWPARCLPSGLQSKAIGLLWIDSVPPEFRRSSLARVATSLPVAPSQTTDRCESLHTRKRESGLQCRISPT